MDKAKIYGALKVGFKFIGFPMLLLIMLITLMPMFNVEIMGDYARNWMLIFVAIWVALVIVKILLDKFVGKKSENRHRLVLVVMAALSILAILLPTTIYDAVQGAKYDEARNALSNSAGVKSYDAVSGWHRDFTTKYNSDVYSLINANYDFMKLYGLEHVYSGKYDNYTEWTDKNGELHSIGYKYGTFEKAEKLLADKKDAQVKLAAAKAELTVVEAQYKANSDALTAAQAAYDASQTDENRQALAAAQDAFSASEDDMVRLKGLRVDISKYKEALVDVVMSVYADATTDLDTIFPDGIGFEIIGIDLGDFEGYLKTILSVISGMDVVNKDMLMGLIPDVIYTGSGAETVTTYQNMVDGSDSDMSLAQVELFNFQINNYPQALAAGAVKYIAFIGVGLVLLSIFVSDYFAKKEKEAKGGENDD